MDQISITPTGFPGSPIAAMAERYGDRLSAGIIHSGQQIEQGLQRMTANRQVAGLGAELSQINPETPDYPQQVMAIASNYPEAMRDPRGQTIVAIGGNAYNRWKATQQAIAQSNMTFGRQLGLENLRSANDIAIARERNKSRANSDVDLSGVDFSGSPMLRPGGGGGPGAGMQFGAGMPRLSGDSTTTGNAPSAPVAGSDETGTLMGIPQTLGGLGGQPMSGNGRTPITAIPSGAAVLGGSETMELPAGSSANRAVIRDREQGLLKRALGPLKEAQEITGIPPNRTQVFGAVAAQRQREQQDKTQEGVQTRADDRLTFQKERDEFTRNMRQKESRMREIRVAVSTAKETWDAASADRELQEKRLIKMRNADIGGAEHAEQERLTVNAGVKEKAAFDAFQRALGLVETFKADDEPAAGQASPRVGNAAPMTPAANAPGQGGYVPGKRYRGATYLGGDPSNPNSWRQ